MDMELIKGQVAGLEQKLREHRGKAAIFQKAQGLDESMERARGEIAKIEADAENKTERLARLIEQKNEALSPTMAELYERTNMALADGEAVFDIKDGKLIIGWTIDDVFKPYDGLSGGEKVAFDGALAHALGAGVIVYEAAEVDRDALADLLHMISTTDAQIIVNTCHEPATVPDGWDVVRL